MKKLILVIVLTLIFTGVEIAGGIMADSIAILSDAAHLVSDVLGLGVSIWAIHIATNEANAKYTYGYHRAEVLGALTSIFCIWAMTAYLVDEATHRFLHPEEHPVIGKIMFIIACCGLIFNVIQISILHTGELAEIGHGHSHGGEGHGHSHGGGGHGHSHGSQEHSHDDEHGHSHGNENKGEEFNKADDIKEEPKPLEAG